MVKKIINYEMKKGEYLSDAIKNIIGDKKYKDIIIADFFVWIIDIKNMEAKEVCYSCSVDLSLYYKIIRKERNCTLSTFIKMCYGLNLCVEEFDLLFSHFYPEEYNSLSFIKDDGDIYFKD